MSEGHVQGKLTDAFQVHHRVQMKPADSENKSEDRKLFVGMLCKKLTEQDLKIMFSPYGTIEECRVRKNFFTALFDCLLLLRSEFKYCRT